MIKVILIFFLVSCSHISPPSGSYAEADLLLEGLIDYVDEKRSYDCLKSSEEAYLLIRALRPILEEREKLLLSKPSLSESDSDAMKDCFNSCSCASIFQILSLSQTKMRLEVLQKEVRSNCRENWIKNICEKSLFKELNKEKYLFDPNYSEKR